MLSDSTGALQVAPVTLVSKPWAASKRPQALITEETPSRWLRWWLWRIPAVLLPFARGPLITRRCGNSSTKSAQAAGIRVPSPGRMLTTTKAKSSRTGSISVTGRSSPVNPSSTWARSPTTWTSGLADAVPAPCGCGRRRTAETRESLGDPCGRKGRLHEVLLVASPVRAVVASALE